MQDLLTWVKDGGPFAIPILVAGAAGLVVAFDRVSFVMKQSRVHSRPFMERVISLARAGSLDEALKTCAEHHSALPDLGLILLRSKTDDEGDLVHVAEAATLAMIPGLSRRVVWLPAIAAILILLGVAGAALNLHRALLDSADHARVAVAYATRPLGLGVILAIPLIAAYAYLVTESQKLAADLNEFAARLVNALIDRPDVRLGHRQPH